MVESPSMQPLDQNDRIMAALAHAAALLPLMGVIVPIIIWVTQRERSKYVSFQALQAVVYQITMILLYFIGMALYMLSFLLMGVRIMLVEGAKAGNGDLSGLVAFVPLLVFMAIMLVGLVFVVYGVVAAILTLQGKDFRYVLLGNALQRYLEKGQPDAARAAA